MESGLSDNVECVSDRAVAINDEIQKMRIRIFDLPR